MKMQMTINNITIQWDPLETSADELPEGEIVSLRIAEGDDGETALFDDFVAKNVRSFGRRDLDAVEEIAAYTHDYQYAAVAFLLEHRGSTTLSDVVDDAGDVILHRGTAADWATSWLEEQADCVKALLPTYMDGYMKKSVVEFIDELLRYASADDYGRDAGFNGEIYEFDFAGETWTCTNPNES